MATYRYVKTDGTIGTTTNQAVAPGIAPTSGFQLIPDTTSTTTRNVNLDTKTPPAYNTQTRTLTDPYVPPTNPANLAYTQFNSALMGLLKTQQSMGTRRFQEQGFNAEEKQNNTILAPTSANLIGASPGTQNSVRTNQAQAYQPLVNQAGNAAQTFGEQIRSLGDAISSAKSFGDSYMSHQENMQSQARDNITQAMQIGGAQGLEAVKKANPEIFKVAGLDYDSLIEAAKAQEKYTQSKDTPTTGGGGTGPVLSTRSVTALKTALNASKFSGAEADGKYADPNLYLQNYQSWINSGGDAATFFKNFPPSTYINPANTWLPPEIMKFVNTSGARSA